MALTRGCYRRTRYSCAAWPFPSLSWVRPACGAGVALSLAMFCSMVPASGWPVCSAPNPQDGPDAGMRCHRYGSPYRLRPLFIRYISPSIFDSMGIYFPCWRSTP